MKKTILALAFLLFIPTGCQAEQKTTEEMQEQTQTSSNIKILSNNLSVITNTSDGYLVSPEDGTETNNLDDKNLELSYSINDTDGDGSLKKDEEFNVALTLTNTSKGYMTFQELILTLDGIDPDSLQIESVDADETDYLKTSNFTIEDGKVAYKNDSTYDIFKLDSGKTITINLVAKTKSDINDQIKAIEMTTLVNPEDGDSFSIDSSLEVEITK